MCLAKLRVEGLRRWNWDGERIIHDSIVPSSRPVVLQQTGGYDIDVREFLVSKDNAIMRRTLERDIRQFIEKLDGASWELFLARTPGAFDLRAYVITEFVLEKIGYKRSDEIDPWQFPDETLSVRTGDCEDRALLIASMLLASGISSFNVRVALGKFRARFGRKQEDIDHVWVMYKDEAGKWQVIDPVTRVTRTEENSEKTKSDTRLPDSAEYIPIFIFNDVHLWSMQSHLFYEGKNAVRLKRDWSKLDPSFAGWVHQTILNEALTPDICPNWILNSLNRHFTSVLSQRSLTVDDVDLPTDYDPRDHFDNGYIDESWKQVASRLKQFRSDGVRNLDAFHRAAHAIGDFYAHTSYGQFGTVAQGKLALYDPDNPGSPLAQLPDYGPGSSFDFAALQFSTNADLWKGSAEEAAALWKGRLISGRYAQKGDSHGIAEMITFMPTLLTRDRSFPLRGSLPHHDEIAVDKDQGANKLYDTDRFAAQFMLRKDAAVRHIRRAFVDNWVPQDISVRKP